jgi:PAS domain S-box-containing protein
MAAISHKAVTEKPHSRLTKAQLIERIEELQQRVQNLQKEANPHYATIELETHENSQSQLLVEATEHCTDGFALFDADDRFVLCNETYRSAMEDIADILKPGVLFEELIRVRARRNQRKDGVERNAETNRKRLDQHRYPKGPLEREFDDGQIVRIQEHKTRDGYTVIIRTDITAEKAAERLSTTALLESEARFQMLVDNPNQSILVHRNHKPLYANPTLAAMYGYGTVEEILNLKTTQKLTHPDFVRGTHEMRLAGSSVPQDREAKGVRKNGEEFWENRRTFVINWDGEPAVCSMRFDITAQKLSTTALLESEARFQTLVDNANQGILVHRNREPFYANPTLAAMYGYGSAEEILNLESTQTLTHPDFESGTHEMRLTGSSVPQDKKTKGVRKNGEDFWEDRRSFVINWSGEPAVCSMRFDITEHKRTEEELLAKEAEFRTLIDNANQGIMVIRHFKPLFANQALADMYGYDSPEEILALKSSRDLHAPSSLEQPPLHEARLRGEEVPTDRDLMGRRKDGTEFWVKKRAFLIDWDGEPAAVSMRLDITENKMAEAELLAKEARFRTLIDNANQGILVISGYKPLYANQALADMYGYESPAEIMVLESSLELRAHSSPIETPYHEARLRGEDVPLDREFMGRRKDGSEFWVNRRAFLIDWEGETAVCSIRMDITERKETQEALRKAHDELELKVAERTTELRESDTRFRGAIANLQEGFSLWDANDRLVIANSDYRRLHPTVDDILKPGLLYEDLLRAFIQRGNILEAEGREEDFIRERMAHHRNPVGPIIRELSNGSWFVVNENRTPDGGVVLTTTDITKRREAEVNLQLALAEAKRANDAKSTFLATMSHELRTPLNAISGFSEVMANEMFGTLGAPKYKEYAGHILTSSHHLLNLINDILDLSAIESGNQSLNKELLNALDVITECSSVISQDTYRKNISYEIDVPADLAPISVDRRAFKQILLNVLANAIKFTPVSGDIKLKARTSENWQIIQISNTGQEISPESLGRITEPFVRGESDPYRAQEGSGLGLAIVKSLVEAHDGKLDIKSDAKKGTTVSISLPRL